MRTTVDIDDDLLATAKALAQRERITVGQVVSRLMRKALAEPAGCEDEAGKRAASIPSKTGFRAFASRGMPITNDAIDRLRDAEGT